MNPKFTSILKRFDFKGAFLGIKPHPVGHIHDTYIASFQRGAGNIQRYLLQRINHRVFKNPPQLMENIQKVTAHLRGKIAAAGGDPSRETLTLVPTKEGKAYYQTPTGEFWRAYRFIENALTYESVQSESHIYHVARAFGRFQNFLRDFPVRELHETIPDFHDTPKRCAHFLEAVEKDARGRASSVKDEIAFVMERSREASIFVDFIQHGKLPLRVTHNDTKFNNVLIDTETGAGVCVVDLDTVLPGLSLYDFGDMVRSGANPAAEAERDLKSVHLDLKRFEAIVNGYLETTRDFLSPLEIDLLPFSAKLMTLECGMRFLTDYLEGDVYFKTDHEDHNLDRCHTQFTMVTNMERKFEQMGEIVEKYR